MSGSGYVMVFVPLHEEMAYIDGHIGALGFKPFPPRSGYDRSSSKHVYCSTAADGTTFILQFQVLDAADRDVMGNISTAAVVLSSLALHRPRLAILVGLAGSLRPGEVGLGDVVVSDAAKYWFPDKLRPIDPDNETFASATDLSPNDVETSRKILVDHRKKFLNGEFFRFRRDVAQSARARHLLARYAGHIAAYPPTGLASPKPGTGATPTICFGSILGSDWVVDSEAFVTLVLERDAASHLDWYTQRARLDPATESESKKRNRWSTARLLAVDMESYGFLKAADIYANESGGNGFAALVVRGISDLAVGKTSLDRKSGGGFRTLAVQNAALVTLNLIARLGEWGVGPR